MTWYKEKTVIEHQVGQYEVDTRQEGNLYVTTLLINRVAMGDAGKYTLTAVNEYGEVKITVSLVVKGTQSLCLGFVVFVVFLSFWSSI